MDDFPPFPGFRPQAFAFLRDLARNNDRDWFRPRKTVYDDEIRWPLRCLIVDAARQATAHGLPLTGDPKRSLFRIHRDTRFSRNKLPYKTAAGAILSRSGSTKDHGVFYIHVEPGRSFLGAGFWRPENTLLQAWRSRTADAPDAFLEIAHTLADTGLSLNHDGQVLKRMPRGFTHLEDTDIGEYLRWKSFTVSHTVDDAALQEPAFTAEVVRMMRASMPLLQWGWALLDATAPS